ncbi:MAG TPA: hypothetical protein PKX92_10045 [Edaphocola sp.]|nr:hypothetical protein [Edaphocola sp.]
MTKYFILIFFSLYFIYSVNAQENLLAYYNNVNKAEIAITKESYKKAGRFYRRAFSNKQIPFAVDLYNSIITNIKINRTDDAILQCFQLAKYRVGKNFFINNSSLTSLRKLQKWHELLNNIDSIENSNKLYNPEILLALNPILNKDFNTHHEWQISNKNNKLKEEMHKIDDSLSNNLIGLFQKYGYLSEYKIGASVQCDTLLLFQPIFYIILLHNYQNISRKDTIFSPILRNGLNNGEVTPTFFSVVQDHGSNIEERIFYGNTLYVSYLGSLYRTKDILDSNIKKGTYNTYINKLRKTIYLCPIEDLEKKIFYNINNPNSEFRIFGPADKIVAFSDKESEEFFYKNSVLIRKNINK